MASALQTLLTATAIAVVFAIARALQRQRAAVTDGWRHLTPGPMMWFAVIGGGAFSGLLCWIYLFVGSSRADGPTQMMILFWLATAFLVMTLAVAYAMLAEQVRWNDEGLERRLFPFGRRTLAWRDLAGFGYEGWSQYLWVAGPDRRRLRFSPYSNGVAELVRKIGDSLPGGVPPDTMAALDQFKSIADAAD